MKIVKSNKLIDLDTFSQLVAGFSKVAVDLGCGDGRFIYKNALANPDVLYIGVDPAIQQADEYARKAARKKLNNAIFAVGSYEILPPELSGIVDELYIILPWGSLLAAVAQPTDESVNKLSDLLKPQGQLTIIFGYDSELEPSQTIRLDLPTLDDMYIKDRIISIFESNRFNVLEFKKMPIVDLKAVESTWGKRISAKALRPIYYLNLKKN